MATPAEELDAYLRAWNAYPVSEVRSARCVCGRDEFQVEVDTNEGGARRTCVACKHRHYLCDSEENWDEDDGEPDECACPCTNETFQLAVGFAFYADSIDDMKWLYIALRCTACGLAGVYADWKIGYGPARQLMDQV